MSLKSAVSLGVVAILANLSFAQDLTKPVIVVNGAPLTYRAYYHKMEHLTGVGRIIDGKFLAAKPGFLALQKLIDEMLLLQLADDKGVAPTDKEVDTEYATGEKDDPEAYKDILSNGLTEDDIRYQIRVQLSEFKLQTIGINIGDQQVEEFYDGSHALYTTPTTYELYMIAADTTDLQDKIDKELKARADFAETAKKYSIDLNAAIGGYMGLRPENELDDRIKSQISLLAKGETTTWIKNGTTQVKFMVKNVIPSKLAPLTPQLRKAIRQRLMVDRGRIKNDLGAWMAEMRKKVKFDYQGSSFDKQIEQLFKGGS